MLIWITPSLAWSDYQEAIDAFDAGDVLSALKEFQALADENDARGQYGLAIMYDLGEGVLQNSEQAAKWYQLSAEQGYAEAQTDLGLAYALGQGVPKDFVVAYAWLNLAAAKGVERAAKPRSIVKRRLTAGQIAEAQRLSRQFAAQIEKAHRSKK